MDEIALAGFLVIRVEKRPTAMQQIIFKGSFADDFSGFIIKNPVTIFFPVEKLPFTLFACVEIKTAAFVIAFLVFIWVET